MLELPRDVPQEELRVGDVIEVWWQPNRDTIIAIRPYTGPLACLKGSRMADFAILKCGMTLEVGSYHKLLARMGEQP